MRYQVYRTMYNGRVDFFLCDLVDNWWMWDWWWTWNHVGQAYHKTLGWRQQLPNQPSCTGSWSGWSKRWLSHDLQPISNLQFLIETGRGVSGNPHQGSQGPTLHM